MRMVCLLLLCCLAAQMKIHASEGLITGVDAAAVFPDYPRIVNVEVEIDSVDWSCVPVGVDGKIKFDIQTSNASGLVLGIAAKDYYFSFDAFKSDRPPHFFELIEYKVDSALSNHSIITDLYDTCLFYNIAAYNHNGGVLGDTILINDYIDDVEIQKAIKEFQEIYTSVEDIVEEKPQIQFEYDQNKIIITDIENKLSEVSIYSMSGLVLHTQKGNNEIDISALPAGLYVVRYGTNLNYKTFKFIKR